jgi:twitching motility protein PilT
MAESTFPRPPSFGSNGAAGGTSPSATPSMPSMPQSNSMQSGVFQETPKPIKKKSIDEVHVDELLDAMMEMTGSSDLHIAVGIPPVVRADGGLEYLPYEDMGPLNTQQMMYAILTDEQIQKFESTWELDFSYAFQKKARFRVNIFRDKGNVSAALRLIPTKIPLLEEMGMPPILEELTHTKRGLILVTGPTGSGKSTTLAAMINHININRAEHILTIEDPVEYLHSHKKSVINQRELGMDTKSFPNALRAALREDPDVILVGEMRDQETMQLAVSAAETGHLVFATLHTNSAATSVDRIVDSFPEGGKEQVRLQLSNNLQAIIAQQLIPSTERYRAATGRGRVAVQEIMIASAAIRNLIREAKAHQITSMIQTSAKMGMTTTDQSLRDAYNRGHITAEMALSRAHNLEELKRMMTGEDAGGSTGTGGRPGQPPVRR